MLTKITEWLEIKVTLNFPILHTLNEESEVPWGETVSLRPVSDTAFRIARQTTPSRTFLSL